MQLRAFHRALTIAAMLCLASACITPKYQRASRKTPAVMLNAHFPPSTLEASLETLIIPHGPGSWKKEAWWDEYVVTLRNTGDQPLQIESAQVLDSIGAQQNPGEDPWKLERESKSLDKRYREAGMTVVRAAAPRVLVNAVEPAVATNVGLDAAGAASAAAASAVALPVVGATLLGIDFHNKKRIQKEFARRRLEMPLDLAPGESRTGSLFFPLIPSPRSLALKISRSASRAQPQDVALPLDFLNGLHLKRE